MADYEIINEIGALEDLAKHLLEQDVVAVDTEADSFYHYFDKTCLVQVATRKNAWLIDPLELGGPAELAPLAPVFASKDVRVLFHAAEYDIFVLKRDCGFTFTNLFDTMVSAQLLGYPAIGLAALIEHHFGLRVPKDEQRSDWSRRPLSDKQLSYAISDVTYLIKLAEKLEKELKKAGRLEWALLDFEALTHRAWPDREFDDLGYLRIKGAKTLDPTSLAILRELFLVRDARAREIDRPPFKVLGNRTLLDIAKEQPLDAESLSAIKGVSDLIIRRMGKNILAAVKKGIKKPHGPIPKIDERYQPQAHGPPHRAAPRSPEGLAWTRARRTSISTRACSARMPPSRRSPGSNPKSGERAGGRCPELKAWFAARVRRRGRRDARRGRGGRRVESRSAEASWSPSQRAGAPSRPREGLEGSTANRVVRQEADAG